MDERKIPFVKPARVGNYKIWRTKTTLGKGKEKIEVEQICISDLDCMWQVRIPATMEIFRTIFDMYAEGEGYMSPLTTIVTNMLAVTSIPNGFFHRAVQLCTMAYANPDILREKKSRKELEKEAKTLADAFLEWAAIAEEQAKSNAPTEEDERNEQVLEEMLEEIDNQE